ncbi:hypothetical protein D3C80_1665540 [compost metagenome]
MRYSAGAANNSAGTDSRFCVTLFMEMSLGVIGMSSTRLLSLAPWRVISLVLRYWPGENMQPCKAMLANIKREKLRVIMALRYSRANLKTKSPDLHRATLYCINRFFS